MRKFSVLGDFGCDVTCQACQASSGLSDRVNWPGYEVEKGPFYWPIGTHNVVRRDFILHFFVLRSFGGVWVLGWVISVNHRGELTICMYVMKQPIMDIRYFAIKLNFWQKDDFKIVYTCKTIFWLLIHITEVYQISHLLEYPSFI